MVRDILLNKLDSKEIFIIVNKQPLTFKEFNRLINKFIQNIQRADYSIRRLAIDFKRKLDVLVAIAGCNRLNIIPIVFPPKNTRVPSVNYGEISGADTLAQDKDCIIQLNRDICLNEEMNIRSIQCVLFTSGSEGVPKAVELTYENIFASATQWNKILKFSKNDYYLNVLPLYHIGGLSIFFRSIYYNFISVVLDYDKQNIVNQVSDNNIDYISVVPKMVHNLIENKDLKILCKKIKMLIIGGDSISKYIYDELGKNNINAYITYGMTETSSGVAGYFLNQNDVYQSGYIGSPHNGVKIGLRDKNIFIKSESVMSGYVNGTYCNNLFITDDIGEVKDEKIYFISRGKDFIVSGGENISLVSIKNIIKNCDGIIDTVVVGCKDDTWGMVPVALFKGNIEISTLSIFCKKELPKHMLPKHFIRINKIPYINNKIDYNLIQYYVKKSLA